MTEIFLGKGIVKYFEYSHAKFCLLVSEYTVIYRIYNIEVKLY